MSPREARDGERGSAVAEFTMVAALVLALFLGIVQVAFAQHVRALVIDAAAEGARLAARADREPEDGVARTRELISTALSASYADDVVATTTLRAGLPVVEVTVRAPLPIVGLLGPSGTMTVAGHALEEAP
ncbi:TadE family protein [Xylanimonas cellulosilytica DSM 15894]|uniref:TadE family protein n=1 Tax=Xylanimonas cellulosilytica (strain DSM 15894 / JCM 12276 / CECT 5975 / KCTC 9989 / LMG 20990 / NBRC 107835 / XIL07) TaxID=446471 RepID=D1BYY5_XYLCX|nr:TadE family protein [Xylanimonas cellulosilytica]ACZ30060.1 TadE family protein [Xylanimonas cellulosilytica DSM 15894]